MSEAEKVGDFGNLRERMLSSGLAGEEGQKQVTRFLSSVSKGSMDGHYLLARAIYGVADDLDEPQRSLMLEQMFHSLMRALEDYASLCLMWGTFEKNPLEIFLESDKAAIRQFYARARKGLPDEILFGIFGVASPELMIKKSLINQTDNYTLESVLGWAVSKVERLLAAFGRVYHSTVDEADPVIGAWQVSHAMSALGAKMLLDEEGRPEELLLGVGEIEGGQKGIYRAKISVDARLGEETLHHVEDVCREIRDLANLQLALHLDIKAGIARATRRFEVEFKSSKKDKEPRVIADEKIKIKTHTDQSGVKEDVPIENKKKQTNKSAKEIKLPSGLKITHLQTIKNDD